MTNEEYFNAIDEKIGSLRELGIQMRESIHTKNILSNRPSADIYIAAKDKQLQAIVVTAEEYKPHSA